MEYSDVIHKLRRVREENKISQEAVADALGLPRTAITQIENGKRAVSTLELSKMAALYHRPVAYFFDETGDIEEDAKVMLFRAEPELYSNPKIKQHIDHYIDLCCEGIHLKKLLEQKDNFLPPNYSCQIPQSKAEAIRQGENIVEAERRRLEIGVDASLDFPQILINQGVWSLSVLLPKEVSGLFVNLKFGMLILVNAAHVKARKRFSYAHEYAHVLFDRASFVKVSGSRNKSELIEVRANAFASAFLMPAKGIENFLRRLNKGQPTRQKQIIVGSDAQKQEEAEMRSAPHAQEITYQDIAAIAHHFGASYPAVVYRLYNLHYFSREICDFLIKQTSIGNEYLKALNMLDDLEGSESPEMNDREFRQQLIYLATEAYRREEISRGRLSELARLIKFDGKNLSKFASAVHRNEKL